MLVNTEIGPCNKMSCYRTVYAIMPSKPLFYLHPQLSILFLMKITSIYSTQDCFKASWSSHKAVHLKAKLSSIATDTPGEKNDSSTDGWLYCLKKGQARTPKLPHFDWTGYSTKFVFLFSFHRYY